MSGPVLGILPARWASQRFPGKPLAQLAGRPVLQHAWEAARQAERVDHVIVATDHPEIEAAARAWGADVEMTSPECPSGSDRVAQAMMQWEERSGDAARAVVNIQGDEPFILPQTLDAAIELLLGDESKSGGDYDVTTAATPIFEEERVTNINNVKAVFSLEGRALYFSRSAIPNLERSSAAEMAEYYRGWNGLQNLDGVCPVYGFKHLGLYAFKREALLEFIELEPSPLEKLEKLEQQRMLEAGMKLGVIGVEKESPGIDTPADLKAAEALLASK
jgi:3-deoxy-manno-octulosonate cytidylyltransferase (CMP-KDO synthetase)